MDKDDVIKKVKEVTDVEISEVVKDSEELPEQIQDDRDVTHPGLQDEYPQVYFLVSHNYSTEFCRDVKDNLGHANKISGGPLTEDYVVVDLTKI